MVWHSKTTLGGGFRRFGVRLSLSFDTLFDVADRCSGTANAGAAMNQHRLGKFVVGFPHFPEIGLVETRSVMIGSGDVCDGESLDPVVGQQIGWKHLVPQELLFVEKADDRSNA